MIVVVMDDGSRRMLDMAKVTLEWKVGESGEVDTFDLSQVRAMMVLDPEFGTAVGVVGGVKMLAMRFTDTSDLKIEVPVPLLEAKALGEQLAHEAKVALGESLETYGTLPGGVPPPPGE